MKNRLITAFYLLFVLAGFYACQESERFAISSDDKAPPSAPTVDSVIALPGGARIYYKIPDDEDLLSIEAAFTATNGEYIKSAVSFLAPPVLEIFGLSDTLKKTIDFYALDRAGNKSEIKKLEVEPLEPTYSRVAKSLSVFGGFGSLLITWVNELKLDVNVFVDFTFSDNGVQRTINQVFSSRDSIERQLIRSERFSASNAIGVQVSVEDRYGNRSAITNKGQVSLLSDELIPKKDWRLPTVGTVIGTVRMSNGDNWEGATRYVIDGIINDILHPGNYGHFGTDYPFNVLIDLGAKYQLSRIRTHQRYVYDIAMITNPTRTDYRGPAGDFYLENPCYNVGIYNMYWWDGNDAGTTGEWKLISQVKIPMPDARLNALQIRDMGLAGDESLMYPDSSGYTPATRWFRYLSVAPFANNYKGSLFDCSLSEITLYGKKAE